MSSTLEVTLPLGEAASARPASTTRKNVIAISIGNGLEMYDFTVYSFFAAIIGQLFFNVGSPAAALLLSLATFGVGFVMRPLGAVLIGNYADRHGRKAALTLTIGLMTLGTALIALTPTYDSIGVAATLILVLGLAHSLYHRPADRPGRALYPPQSGRNPYRARDRHRTDQGRAQHPVAHGPLRHADDLGRHRIDVYGSLPPAASRQRHVDDLWLRRHGLRRLYPAAGRKPDCLE
jgi:hypothetical protein